MASAKGPLGCGAYTARLVNNGKPIAESSRVTTAQWNRRSNEPSTAVIALPTVGTALEACCQGIDRLEALRTEVILTRNGVDVWQGFIMDDVSFRRDTIVINARDIMGWLERRRLRQNHAYANIDLTDIALGFIADVNSAGDLPFTVDAEDSGVLATRTVLANEYRYAWDPFRELLETGLDATVIAGVLRLGPELQLCGPIHLSDQHLEGDPEIKTDGRQRASQVVVKGANGIVGVFPAVVDAALCFYPADYVVTDERILDQSSSDARAESLYNDMSSSYPYFVAAGEGASLKPNAPVHINALAPGAIVQYHTDSLCVELDMAMRVSAVDVDVAPGIEQVRVTLEPLGSDQEGPVI